MLYERLLQRMKGTVLGQSFNGNYFLPGNILDGVSAGLDRLIVNNHRADAALVFAAAILGAVNFRSVRSTQRSGRSPSVVMLTERLLSLKLIVCSIRVSSLQGRPDGRLNHKIDRGKTAGCRPAAPTIFIRHGVRYTRVENCL